MAKYFNNNLKYIRLQKNVSQQELADKIGTDRSNISRWENSETDTPLEMAIKIADVFNIPYYDFFGKDLQFDNAEQIPIVNDTIKIPVLGVIKAGIPIEAQQDIIEYIEIPKSWAIGGKQFYGLKISGDSMFPKYNDKDTVIFEKTLDMSSVNNKDCAVMVNGDDATFKKVILSNDSIVLIPYNNNYDTKVYSKEEIETLPVNIVGIAKEKRVKLD